MIYPQQRRPPVHDGQVLELEVTEQGSRGDGVARLHGYVVFVKDSHPGDRGKVRITRATNKCAFGEFVEGEP